MKTGIALIFAAMFIGCSKDNDGESPEFLDAAYIWTITSNTLKTYDFTKHPGTGENRVTMRVWTLDSNGDWQATHEAIGNVTATTSRIRIVSAYGGEEWTVTKVDNTSMILGANAQQSTWYSCAAISEWPPAIRNGTQGCN